MDGGDDDASVEDEGCGPTFAPAVETRLEELGREFLDAFVSMNETRRALRHVSTTPPSVSTITCTGRLNVTSVPVERMRLAAEVAEELDDPLEFEVDCELAKRAAKRAVAAAKKRKRDGDGGDGDGGGDDDGDDAGKRFCYQLPLRRNGKSLKLFHNGSVQATGCSCPVEFVEMVDALRGFVAETAGWAPDAVRLLHMDVQLINTLFVLVCPTSGRPLTVAPGALRAHMWASSGTHPDFDTERHPAVKIPLIIDGVKCATVCVFQTGSVSIMGAKRPLHVAMAYDMVCRAVDDAAPHVCRPDTTRTMRTTTAKAPLALEEGYPFKLYACCQHLGSVG